MKNNETESVYRFYRYCLRSDFDIGERMDETGYDLTLLNDLAYLEDQYPQILASVLDA